MGRAESAHEQNGKRINTHKLKKEEEKDNTAYSLDDDDVGENNNNSSSDVFGHMMQMKINKVV